MPTFDSAIRAISIAMLLAVAACDSDDTTTSNPTSSDGGTAPSTSSAPDAINEAALAGCPSSSTLITSTEWPTCLAGRRVSGTEPFNKSPCELRVGQNGAFEYWRSGALALSVTDRASWRSGSGTYQNDLDPAGRRTFLASVQPDLPVVEGQPRVTKVSLTFASLLDDSIEIEYLDAGRVRQTYTCSVAVI